MLLFKRFNNIRNMHWAFAFLNILVNDSSGSCMNFLEFNWANWSSQSWPSVLLMSIECLSHPTNRFFVELGYLFDCESVRWILLASFILFHKLLCLSHLNFMYSFELSLGKPFGIQIQSFFIRLLLLHNKLRLIFDESAVRRFLLLLHYDIRMLLLIRPQLNV